MFSDATGINLPLVLCLAVINIPFFWILYWALFSDVDELVDAIKFWITPDLISAIRGEYASDIWAELKLFLLVGGCVALVGLEYVLIQGYLAGTGP